jgi:hypothetical protein
MLISCRKFPRKLDIKKAVTKTDEQAALREPERVETRRCAGSRSHPF